MALECLDEALTKRFSDSLVEFMRLIDPDKKFSIDLTLSKEWSRLPLDGQRKLYLYLLYRKWRGLDIFGEPYYIIRNCHPVPYNWNGWNGIEELIKSKRLVKARFNNGWGIYTKDEANLYKMDDIEPLKPLND